MSPANPLCHLNEPFSSWVETRKLLAFWSGSPDSPNDDKAINAQAVVEPFDVSPGRYPNPPSGFWPDKR